MPDAPSHSRISTYVRGPFGLFIENSLEHEVGVGVMPLSKLFFK